MNPLKSNALMEFVKKQAKSRKITQEDYLLFLAEAEMLREDSDKDEDEKLHPLLEKELSQRLEDIASGKAKYIDASQVFASIKSNYLE